MTEPSALKCGTSERDPEADTSSPAQTDVVSFSDVVFATDGQDEDTRQFLACGRRVADQVLDALTQAIGCYIRLGHPTAPLPVSMRPRGQDDD